MTPRGTCFGYQVHSPEPFTFLRRGGGDRLDVAWEAVEPVGGELVYQWGPPRVATWAGLYGLGDRHELVVDGVGSIGIEPRRPRLSVPTCDDLLRLEERLWGVPMLLCFVRRGDVPLHAAAVEVDGEAVVLAAPTRFGKSTLLAALARDGLRLLTEDLACLRLEAEGASIVPGPAMLRLRRDIADRVAPAHFHEVGRDGDRLHLVDGRDAGTGDPVPIRAVVLLRDDQCSPTLEHISPVQALADLWSVSFHLPTPADRARCFRDVTDLAARLPLFALRRRLGLTDLPATIESVLKAGR